MRIALSSVVQRETTDTRILLPLFRVSQHVARVHSVVYHLQSEATRQANPWLKRIDEKALKKLACSFYEQAKRMKPTAEVEACFCGRPKTQVLAMRMWEK